MEDQELPQSMWDRLPGGPLAGQMSVSDSMFGAIAPTKPSITPTPEEMEAERNKILYNKHVKVKAHCVRIFDMHVAKQRDEYEKLMLKLMIGVQALTHKIWANEKQLVSNSAGQRWMRYLEWSVFELHVDAVAPVPSAGDTNE